MEYFNKTNEDWRLGLCCQFHDRNLAVKFNANTTTKTSFLKDRSKARVAATRNVDKLKLYFVVLLQALLSFYTG